MNQLHFVKKNQINYYAKKGIIKFYIVEQLNLPNFPKCKLKNVSKFCILYLGKRKVEEEYFVNKNTKVSISMFRSAETIVGKMKK